MPAVTLTKGQYWIGDPKLVLPDWKPSVTHTYKCGPYTFHAFKFGDSYVGAIPFDAMIYVTQTSQQGAFMTFKKDTVFYEQNGMGKLNGVELGVIGDELIEEPLPHITNTDNPIDFPKTKKAKSAQADKV